MESKVIHVWNFGRVYALILIMAGLALVIGGGAIGVLYDAAFTQTRANLMDKVQAQARLIESVARFDRRYSRDFPEGSRAATLSQVADSFRQSEGFGSTGEFVLGRHEGSSIVFMLHQRNLELHRPAPVPLESRLAEPMRRALDGETGTIIAPDYRGILVLAAFAPIDELNLGLVAKMDLSEFRSPFVHAGLLVGIIAITAILLGSFLFFHAAEPMVRDAKESDERFGATFEQAAVGIAHVAPDGRWLRVNRRLCEIVGYSREDLLALTFQDITHPEDLDADIAKVEDLLAGRAETYVMEKRYFRKNGTLVWINLTVSLVRAQDGSPKYFISVIEDISERKAADEQVRKLSLAVEQSPNMVIITNHMGMIEYVNPRFTEMTGFAADEALGRSPALIKSDATPTETHAALWQAITNGQEWRGELQDKRKDGSPFWVSASISPLRGADGLITHFVAMEEDITQRKLSEIEMRKAKEQAEVANRAKTEMLANMSHELRTPLNAIIGYSDSILEGIFGPVDNTKHAEYLGDIRSSGNHLLALINDVLDVSAIEAGRLDLHQEAIDLVPLAAAAGRLVGPRAEQGEVEVTIDVPDTLPLLYGDQRRVKQILLNLLSNAVKFTPEGGQVTLRARNEPTGTLAITVLDTGIGMDPEDLVKALTPFGQADSGLDRKYEGTGLGLPLTVSLIELHGGSLDIESARGMGTRATIRFPAQYLLPRKARTKASAAE